MGISLVLGSANFGQQYGIFRNEAGPTVEKSMAQRIVTCALELGINEIDTALTYGPAQSWLAGFPEISSFRINSKIPWMGLDGVEKYSNQLKQISEMFSDAGVLKIQWHNWEDEDVDSNSYLAMHSALQNIAPVNFGVTTYGVNSVQNALQVSSFGSVQLEFNILNQAPLNAYKSFDSESKPCVYIRSILLQGALTDDGLSRIQTGSKLQQYLLKAKELAQLWSLPLHELALRASITAIESGSIVVGVNTASQLEELCFILESGPLPIELVKQIEHLDAGGSAVVDPRSWTTI